MEIEQLHGGRYTGKIVWEGFDAQDAIDRQKRMRQALEKELGADSKQVGVVFAYTPREMQVMSAT